MGMNLAGMQRLMGAADKVMRDLFPARLRIGGREYEACGVGGNALNEFLEGGRAERGVRYFRVEKGLLTDRPKVGETIEWIDAEGPVKRLQVAEVPDRPHETSWVLVCAPKQ